MLQSRLNRIRQDVRSCTTIVTCRSSWTRCAVVDSFSMNRTITIQVIRGYFSRVSACGHGNASHTECEQTLWVITWDRRNRQTCLPRITSARLEKFWIHTKKLNRSFAPVTPHSRNWIWAFTIAWWLIDLIEDFTNLKLYMFPTITSNLWRPYKILKLIICMRLAWTFFSLQNGLREQILAD